MKWNGDAEEALSRLLEGLDFHSRSRAEAQARMEIEKKARREGIEEIDARLVLSTLVPETAPEDQERVRKVIRSLGMRPEEFF
jgi:hypothetical protein